MIDTGLSNKKLLICAAVLMSLVTAGWTAWTRTLGNHECFVSITAREMTENNDWVMPTCNAEPRLQKTPLSYWLVSGVSKLTGRIDEITARIPSILFGVFSVLAIIYFVKLHTNMRTALISACVWSSTLSYVRYARNARPEMVLVFFTTVCFLSFYSAIVESNRRRQIIYMLVFWVSFSLSMLAKGPAPLPLVGVPLFVFVLFFRQFKNIPKMLPIVGSIIFLAIVLPWPIAIANKMNWDMTIWKHEFVDRFFGDYASGDKSFFYYFPRMFSFIAPWSAFLVMALVAPFYKIWSDRRRFIWFLWVWFVADLIFLTINGGKRQHYILPIMPAASIMIGIILEDMSFTRIAYTARDAAIVLKGHIAVIVIAAVTIPFVVLYISGNGPIHAEKTNQYIMVCIVLLSCLVILCAFIVSLLFWKNKNAAALVAAFAGITVIIMAGLVTFINPLDYNNYSRVFSKRLAEIVPASENLEAFEYVSNRSVQYFGRCIPEIKDIDALYGHYQNGMWVMATTGHLEKLQKDSRFRMVYYRKKAERRCTEDGPGGLFHISAEMLTEE